VWHNAIAFKFLFDLATVKMLPHNADDYQLNLDNSLLVTLFHLALRNDDYEM